MSGMAPGMEQPGFLLPKWLWTMALRDFFLKALTVMIRLGCEIGSVSMGVSSAQQSRTISIPYTNQVIPSNLRSRESCFPTTWESQTGIG